MPRLVARSDAHDTDCVCILFNDVSVTHLQIDHGLRVVQMGLAAVSVVVHTEVVDERGGVAVRGVGLGVHVRNVLHQRIQT